MGMDDYRILTVTEAIEMLEHFRCSCGLTLTPSELCFKKMDRGWLFECPQCGDLWTLEEMGSIQ
jgi:hypothetical protein